MCVAQLKMKLSLHKTHFQRHVTQSHTPQILGRVQCPAHGWANIPKLYGTGDKVMQNAGKLHTYLQWVVQYNYT